MLANVYGPGPKSSSTDRGILNQMIRKAMKGQNLTLYGKGDQMRDYIFVEDVIEAFLAAAVKKREIDGRSFLLASGIGTTLSEAFHLVARRVQIKVGQLVDVQSVEPPEESSSVDSRHFVGNINAIRSSLKWEPKHPLLEGIDRTIDYFLGETK